MNKVKLECQGCTKRYPGCHAGCSNFQEWKDQHDKEKKEIAKTKWLNRIGKR